jgi:hypothetical protein
MGFRIWCAGIDIASRLAESKSQPMGEASFWSQLGAKLRIFGDLESQIFLRSKPVLAKIANEGTQAGKLVYSIHIMLDDIG